MFHLLEAYLCIIIYGTDSEKMIYRYNCCVCKDNSRLSHYNFGAGDAMDLLFFLLHAKPFRHGKIYFWDLH